MHRYGLFSACLHLVIVHKVVLHKCTLTLRQRRALTSAEKYSAACLYHHKRQMLHKQIAQLVIEIFCIKHFAIFTLRMMDMEYECSVTWWPSKMAAIIVRTPHTPKHTHTLCFRTHVQPSSPCIDLFSSTKANHRIWSHIANVMCCKARLDHYLKT